MIVYSMSSYASPLFEQKILTPACLPQALMELPRPLVFTNGCFDILHRGHVTYLAQAKALGASMIVGVNSDASVKRLGKGQNRPINPESQRIAVLAALESVDVVVGFKEDTPLSLILLAQPDILVKGGDWPLDKIVGYQEVLSRGGSVHAIPFLFETSTTQMVEKIRAGG